MLLTRTLTVFLLSLSAWGDASAPKTCPLGDLRRVPIEAAAKLRINPESAERVLDSPRGSDFLNLVRASQWLDRPAGQALLDKLASNLYDPAFNQRIKEKTAQWNQTVGAAPVPFDLKTYRRLLLDETIAETKTRIPEDIKNLWVDGLSQIPHHPRLGISTTPEEHKARVEEYLRRPIPSEARKEMARSLFLNMFPMAPPTNRLERRLIQRESRSMTDEQFRAESRNMINKFVLGQRKVQVNPGTPGDRQRLERLVNADLEQGKFGGPALAEYIRGFFSYVLLGEKTPVLGTPEIAEFIRAPLFARANYYVDEQRKRVARELRQAEQTAQAAARASATPVSLPKREKEARPVPTERRKPEPRIQAKQLLTDAEIEARMTAGATNNQEPPLDYPQWSARLTEWALNPREFKDFLEAVDRQSENVQAAVAKKLEKLARTGYLDPTLHEIKKVYGNGQEAIYQIIMIANHNTNRILVGYEPGGQARILSARDAIKAGRDGANNRQDDWIRNTYRTWTKYLRDLAAKEP